MVSLSQGHGCSIIYLSKIQSGSEIFTIQYNHDSFSRESYVHFNHKFTLTIIHQTLNNINTRVLALIQKDFIHTPVQVDSFMYRCVTL